MVNVYVFVKQKGTNYQYFLQAWNYLQLAWKACCTKSLRISVRLVKLLIAVQESSLLPFTKTISWSVFAFILIYSWIFFYSCVFVQTKKRVVLHMSDFLKSESLILLRALVQPSVLVKRKITWIKWHKKLQLNESIVEFNTTFNTIDLSGDTATWKIYCYY